MVVCLRRDDLPGIRALSALNISLEWQPERPFKHASIREFHLDVRLRFARLDLVDDLNRLGHTENKKQDAYQASCWVVLRLNQTS